MPINKKSVPSTRSTRRRAPAVTPASAPSEPEARYPLRIQAIRAKGKNPSFYVYIPTPLAAALGISGGEEVAWELLARDELHLLRLAAPPVKAVPRK